MSGNVSNFEVSIGSAVCSVIPGSGAEIRCKDDPDHLNSVLAKLQENADHIKQEEETNEDDLATTVQDLPKTKNKSQDPDPNQYLDEFWCQICSHRCFPNQYKFYLHLKRHYDKKAKPKNATKKQISEKRDPSEIVVKIEFPANATGASTALPTSASSPADPTEVKEVTEVAEVNTMTKSGRLLKPNVRNSDLESGPVSPRKKKSFPCEFCTKVYGSLSGLQGHEFKAHREEAKARDGEIKKGGKKRVKAAAPTVKIRKPAQCQICFKILSDSTALQIHERIHKGERRGRKKIQRQKIQTGWYAELLME